MGSTTWATWASAARPPSRTASHASSSTPTARHAGCAPEHWARRALLGTESMLASLVGETTVDAFWSAPAWASAKRVVCTYVICVIVSGLDGWTVRVFVF